MQAFALYFFVFFSALPPYLFRHGLYFESFNNSRPLITIQRISFSIKLYCGLLFELLIDFRTVAPNMVQFQRIHQIFGVRTFVHVNGTRPIIISTGNLNLKFIFHLSCDGFSQTVMSFSL